MSERDMRRYGTCGSTRPEDLELLSYTAAGKVLGYSRWTIRALVRAGQLRVVPAGEFHRIPMYELRRYVREQLVSCGPSLKSKTDLRLTANRRPS